MRCAVMPRRETAGPWKARPFRQATRWRGATGCCLNRRISRETSGDLPGGLGRAGIGERKPPGVLSSIGHVFNCVVIGRLLVTSVGGDLSLALRPSLDDHQRPAALVEGLGPALGVAPVLAGTSTLPGPPQCTNLLLTLPAPFPLATSSRSLPLTLAPSAN